MGQQASKRPVVKKKSWKQQARIQGLYEMYTQSIRLSTLIKSHQITGLKNNDKSNENASKKHYKNKQSQSKKSQQQQQKFLQQLLQSFELRDQFSWSQQIPQLFKKHFSNGFQQKWQQSKELFYQLLLQNVGVDVQGEQLVGKSRIGNGGFYRQGSRIVVVGDKDDSNIQNNISKSQFPNRFNTTNNKNNKVTTFEQYFHQIIKQRSSMNIRSSFLVNDEDHIDRRKQQQIAQVQSQRMTLQEQINFINQSIIDAQTIEERQNQTNNGSENNNNNNHSQHPQLMQHQGNNYQSPNSNINKNINNNNNNVNDDDQYFLPLITKRHKHKKHKKQQQKNNYSKLADRISQQSSYSQHQIEMSHFPSKVKYSKIRLESSSVILPSTIFYQRMNFSAKVETDQSLKIYRQLSNTIQQTINSCNLISCPLKHFLLYFEYKTSKKKINQLNQSKSTIKLNKQGYELNGSTLTFNKKTKSSDSMKHIPLNKNINQSSSVIIMQNQNKNKSSPFIPQSSSQIRDNNNRDFYNQTQNNNNIKSVNTQQDLYQTLIQVSEKSQIIRKKRQFNTNYLLKQVKQFTQAYTQFLYKYLNFDKIEMTDLSTFINLDTVYGIVLRNIWNIVNWIADRGYQWEEYALLQVVDNQNPYFETFTQNQIQQSPSLILKSYAAFCNKDLKKIKTDPIKLCKAYTALLKLKNQVFPQKYLKKIIIFYRQATKCCQGADDLMTLYEFLLKNCILNNFTEQMHIFRMKNIIDKLIPIESSAIDGAGEIVYAWTTWNIILQVFNIKLKQHKKVLLAENEKKTAIYQANRAMTQKKKLIEKNQQQKYSNNKQKLEKLQTPSKVKNQLTIKSKNHQNPQRRIDRKLQFTLTSCHEIQE